METDDLSLIEMNKINDDLMADVSLILKNEMENSSRIANLGVVGDENLIDFSCSPLQLDRSTNPVFHSRFQPPHPVVMESNKGESSTTSISGSSPAKLNNGGKENLNHQNLSLRSPCQDPQETKRRKKRGGYNLRKSIAWNKAFFTEEGVLDASELSRLSKPSPRLLSSPMFLSSPLSLSSVAEEGGSSFRKGAKVRGAGSNLNSVRGNLFSGSPKKSPVNEGRRVTIESLSTTHSSAQKAASPIIRASRRVQLTKAPSGSISPGGGCPRPTTLASQRRIPNSSTLNRTVKDSKIPKPTIAKAESSSLSAISKNIAVGSKASKLNRNLPPPPAVPAEKSVGLRRGGSSLIPEKKPNCASSSSRPYGLRSSKTSVSLSKDKHLSTDLRPAQSVKGTKIGQKTNPHPVLGADKHKAITESCAEVDNPAAHNSNCISEDIPNPQSQPAKVTGLRMPSPSLRFFDQPKSSVSVNVQLSNHRDSGIPIARKQSQSNRIVEPKPLTKLDETAKLTKGSAEATKVEVGSTSKCSVPPVASVASYTKLKPKIEPRNVQAKAKVSASSSFNQTSSQEESDNLNIDGDKQELKEERTKSHIHDEVGQIRHEVNLGSELTHTSICQTSPALIQRDNKLGKQVTPTDKKHDEVELILHDAHMCTELRGNQLQPHAGSPEQFQMDNLPEKQEDARNDKDGEVDQTMHEVNLETLLNKTSPVCHTSPVPVQNDDQLEKQEIARDQNHSDVQMGLELSGNQLPPHAGSPEQFQMDNLPEKQEDARNDKDGEVGQTMHEVNLETLLNKTSPVCHTSPVPVQNDDQLEKQAIARDQNHSDVQMRLELSGNQLPPHAGSPEQFEMDNLPEKQEDARNDKDGEVDETMHEVNLETLLNKTSPVCHTSPVPVQNDDRLEKQEIARDQNHSDVQMGLELSGNQLPPHAGSPEQFQMDNLPEKQEDARNDKDGEVDQTMHEVNLETLLNKTSSVCHTSPVPVQNDDQLEKQEIARYQNHSDVQMGLEPSDNRSPLNAGSPERFRKDNQFEKQEDGRYCIQDGVDQIMDEVNLGRQLRPSAPCPISPEQEHKNYHFERQEDTRHLIHDEVDQIMHEVGLRPELNNPLLVSLTFPEQNQKDTDFEKQEAAANHIHDEVEPVSYDVDMDLDLSDDEQPLLRTGYHGVSVEMTDVEEGQLKSLCTDMSIGTCVSIPSIQLGDGDDNSAACTSAMNAECVQVVHSVRGELGEVEELINQFSDGLDKSKPSEKSQGICCFGSSSDVQTPGGLVMQLRESCSEVSSIEKILQAKNSHFEPPSHSPGCCDINQNCCPQPEDVSKQAEEQLVLQENHHMLEMKASTPLLDAEECLDVGKPYHSEVKVDHVLEIIDTSLLNEEESNLIKHFPKIVEADLRDRNPISEINDSTSPLHVEDHLNDRMLSSTEAGIDLHGGYHVWDMSDNASVLESVSSEESDNDNALVLPAITPESIICADMEVTYPSGNMCGSLKVEEHDAAYYSEIEHPHVEVAVFQCLENKPLPENHESPCHTPNNYPSEHNFPQVSVGLQSALKISEGQTANSVATCVSTSTDNDLKNCISLEKTPTTLGNSGTPNGVIPLKCESSSTMGSKGNSLEVPNKSALALKKLNAVPFSDEWLAAHEAAGEDILAMKTGAVQNSPPDKPVPEPSPWSPVKRKHQEIGPFDCTKCTNLPAPPSS